MAELRAGRRPPDWAVFLGAFIGYALLAIVLTFPLILHVSSRVPMDLEDSLWYVTILWWNAHVMPLTEQWWNGFAFYPATGMMAFSDHMLGASLIASPLQWLGAGPIAAYNLTFLASFALSAVAAHALAFTLTRRHDAAMICGLAYGFNPYRIAHLAHLELLLAFGMPMALVALHRYVETRGRGWLAAFSGALALQALSASYYALFFGVLLAIWTCWFIRPRAWRDALMIAAAGAAAVIALWPVLAGYSEIHRAHNLSRGSAEVLTSSADVTSLVSASAFSVPWGWTSSLNGGERQLFPGLTVIALVVIGTTVTWRRQRAFPRPRDRWTTASTACWAVCICLIGVAIFAWAAGPWKFEYGWLRLSVSVPYKPLSLALAFAIAAAAASPTMRMAFAHRSLLAFYVIAAVVLFLCSLGPRPAFLGEQILYEPPYAWLMRLPFFADGAISVPSVRVPARFGMLVALALSTAAALAFTKLASSPRRRNAVLVAAVAGIIADASIRALPLLDPSRSVPAPAADDTAALMMLPLGNTRTDTAAMHWGTISGRPVVNGYHSYAPLSYHVLRLALEDRDPSVLHALATVGPVVIAVDNHGQDSWTSFVADHPRSVRLRQENNWTLFLLPFEPLRQHECAPASVPVAAAFTDNGHVNETLLTDASIGTWWSTGHPQRAGDALILDTGSIVTPCEIVLSLGSYAGAYPRALRISTSPDGVAWDTGFVRELGGMTFLAARDDPTNPRIRLPISSARAARFIRLEIERGQRDYPWMVADIAIYGPAEPGLRHTARDARASLTANGSAGDRDAGAAVTRRTDSSSE